MVLNQGNMAYTDINDIVYNTQKGTYDYVINGCIQM